MTKLLKNPWLLGESGNEWETRLRSLASSLGIEDWNLFRFRVQTALSSKYMVDHVTGAPSLGKQLAKAKRLRSTSQKLVSIIEDILGNVQTEARHSGSYTLLRLLDQAGGIKDEDILQDPHTEDLLNGIKESADSLIRRLDKLESHTQRSRGGNRERLGTKEFWRSIATYWVSDLGRSTHIRRSGGQKNSEDKYSGDFIDFAWSLNQILSLETNSKEALGEMLCSTIK